VLQFFQLETSKFNQDLDKFWHDQVTAIEWGGRVPFPATDHIFLNNGFVLCLYLDASFEVKNSSLGSRFLKSWEQLQGTEVACRESVWFGVAHDALRSAVRGCDLYWTTHLVAEGQLARLTLNTGSVLERAGFFEAWLCAASRIFDSEALEHLFDLAPKLVTDAMEGVEETRAEDQASRLERIPGRTRELYTSLAACMVTVRDGVPADGYKLKDEDFRCNIGMLPDSIRNAPYKRELAREGYICQELRAWYRNTLM